MLNNSNAANKKCGSDSEKRPVVCAYYFPNWHPDPRNDYWHGKGWTEWNVVKHATPRFPGHKQPKIPLWGYEDESDPKVMEKKIREASSHGIDGFIFDWYWFDDGPYRIKCLDEGFLGASNTNDMKFAVMWANHDPICVHPGSRMFPRPSLKSGLVPPQAFFEATEHCIKNYFNRPNYLRLDGKLYFPIYKLDYMVEGLGGIEAAAGILKDFRRRVHEAGLGEMNINTITSSIGESDPMKANELLETLGIDSCTTYGWSKWATSFPAVDYWKAAEINIRDYEIQAQTYKVPFYPTVCMGWDVSPRAVQSEIYENVGYPFMSVIVGNTPEMFGKALEAARDFVLSGKTTGNLINLNCWNEWTEGSYLEPDTENGYGYLNEVKRVFRGKF